MEGSTLGQVRNGIAARTGVDAVSPVATNDLISTTTGVDGVISAIAINVTVARTAGQRVIAGSAEKGCHRAPHAARRQDAGQTS
jgi:hypothetical protein